MAKISALKPGQVVYDVGSYKMGNTSLRTVGIWTVVINEVDPDGQFVVASWNHNQAKKFYARTVSKWKVNKPILMPTGWSGQMRRATRAEIAAMKKD